MPLRSHSPYQSIFVFISRLNNLDQETFPERKLVRLNNLILRTALLTLSVLLLCPRWGHACDCPLPDPPYTPFKSQSFPPGHPGIGDFPDSRNDTVFWKHCFYYVNPCENEAPEDTDNPHLDRLGYTLIGCYHTTNENDPIPDWFRNGRYHWYRLHWKSCQRQCREEANCSGGATTSTTWPTSTTQVTAWTTTTQ